MQWMIYGATGYTGTLVAEEALRRGHQPIIAGRDVDKLRLLSERLDVEYAAFRLDDVGTIAEAIAGMDAVYHAAGPFIHTSDPMIRACLATNTHYLDITGQIRVFEHTYTYDEAARKNGIALISGVGFDVVPTDCLALYVAQQIPGAATLDIGLSGFAGISAGTAKSSLEILAAGGLVRQNGRLVAVPIGHRTRTIPLSKGPVSAMAVPWGDMAAVYRSTGVATITTYMALPRALITLAKFTAPLGRQLAKNPLTKAALERVMGRVVNGPDADTRESARAYFWAQAHNPSGQSAEAWLETAEPYQFTARAGVLAVEYTLELQPVGALSPAQAFGADFVLDVAGTVRLDSI